MRSLSYLPPLTISILLFIVSFSLYYPSLEYDFLSWDTKGYLMDVPMIQSLTWEHLREMMTSFKMGNWHPLTWFSYALDYAIYGLNAWGFHLSNLLWHSANTVLFFLLGLQLLKLAETTPNNSWAVSSPQQLWIAGLAALWFGIHPQHIESVVWVAERKDVLSLFFSLLTIKFYLNYGQQRQPTRYVLSLLCCYLALMAKPMAVTLPVIMLLLDIYPLQRVQPQWKSLFKLLVEKTPFFLGSLVCAILTFVAQHQAEAVASLVQVSIEVRIANAFHSILFYLSKFLLPLGLSPLYPLDLTLLNNPFTYVTILATLLVTVLSLYAWRKAKAVWLISWMFYLISLLPVLGIIQVGSQAAADRYAYLPTLPFYLLVASFWVKGLLHPQRHWQLLAGGGAIILSFGLGYATLMQSSVWRNDLVFWSYVHNFSPVNTLAQANLGKVYLRMGDKVKALELWECRSADHLKDEFTEQEYTAAIANLEYAALRDTTGLTRYNLAQCYANTGKFTQALTNYEYLLANLSEDNVAPEIIYYQIGKTYFEQGKYPAARVALDKVLVLDPQAGPVRELLKRIPALHP